MRGFIASALESAASLTRPDYNLDDEINKLGEELRTIASTKEVVNTDWWKQYRKWADRNAQGYKDSLNELAQSPVKNANEIIHLHALAEILTRIIDTVENTLSRENDVIERKNELEKRTEDNTLPPGLRDIL